MTCIVLISPSFGDHLIQSMLPIFLFALCVYNVFFMSHRSRWGMCHFGCYVIGTSSHWKHFKFLRPLCLYLTHPFVCHLETWLSSQSWQEPEFHVGNARMPCRCPRGPIYGGSSLNITSLDKIFCKQRNSVRGRLFVDAGRVSSYLLGLMLIVCKGAQLSGIIWRREKPQDQYWDVVDCWILPICNAEDVIKLTTVDRTTSSTSKLLIWQDKIQLLAVF